LLAENNAARVRVEHRYESIVNDVVCLMNVDLKVPIISAPRIWGTSQGISEWLLADLMETITEVQFSTVSTPGMVQWHSKC